MREVVNEAIDCLFLNLYIVQTDAQVGCKVEFASQIT